VPIKRILLRQRREERPRSSDLNQPSEPARIDRNEFPNVRFSLATLAKIFGERFRKRRIICEAGLRYLTPPAIYLSNITRLP
jgi:hypothetical protein